MSRISTRAQLQSAIRSGVVKTQAKNSTRLPGRPIILGLFFDAS